MDFTGNLLLRPVRMIVGPGGRVRPCPQVPGDRTRPLYMGQAVTRNLYR